MHTLQRFNAKMMIAVVCLSLTGVSAPVSHADELPSTTETKLPADVKASDLPDVMTPLLVKGRDVWSGTCQGCHGSGVAGSPKIANKKAWAPRIAKGMDTLVKHAINGFWGPEYTEMPARGGNDKLSDDQIAAAVAYMVEMSRKK